MKIVPIVAVVVAVLIVIALALAVRIIGSERCRRMHLAYQGPGTAQFGHRPDDRNGPGR